MSTGIFNTSNFVAANTVPSFATAMAYVMPNGDAPLFAISSMLAKTSAINYVHSYWTKTMLFQSLAVTEAYISTDTTLAVADSSNVLPGMIFRVAATGENIIINTVASSTSVTVSRGVGTVAADSIADNGVLYFVGNAYEEGSSRPTALKISEVQVSNYTQIFRNAWAVTGTAAVIQKYVGADTVQDNRDDAAKEHAKSIEFNLMFGQKFLGTRNGQPFHLMGGIEDACRTNSLIVPAASTTTYTQLEAMVNPVFDYNTDPAIGNKRLILCGSGAQSVINNIGRLNGDYQLVDGQTNFGMQFKTFVTSRGEFTIMVHPLLCTNALFKTYAFVLDIGSIRLPYLGGRDTVYEEYGLDAGGNVRTGDAGIDAKGGSYLTELTMELRNPLSCRLITGLTAAAVG